MTITKFGTIDEHKTFKGFTNIGHNLNRKEFFEIFGGDKLISKVPLKWKKSFSHGVLIPHKMKNCTNGEKDILCDECDKLVKRNKEFSANLIGLKGQSPNELRHMLPKYITT